MNSLPHKKLLAITPFDAYETLAQLQAGLSERERSLALCNGLGWHWQYSSAHFVSTVSSKCYGIHLGILVRTQNAINNQISISHCHCSTKSLVVRKRPALCLALCVVTRKERGYKV